MHISGYTLSFDSVGDNWKPDLYIYIYIYIVIYIYIYKTEYNFRLVSEQYTKISSKQSFSHSVISYDPTLISDWLFLSFVCIISIRSANTTGMLISMSRWNSGNISCFLYLNGCHVYVHNHIHTQSCTYSLIETRWLVQLWRWFTNSISHCENAWGMSSHFKIFSFLVFYVRCPFLTLGTSFTYTACHV